MMEEELMLLKKRVNNPNILSSFDLKKKTILYMDASHINYIGYILIQEDSEGNKFLISCDSSRLTQA